MALSKNYSIEVYGQSIAFENAYFEILSINGTKDNMNINVNIYDSSEKINTVDTKYYSYTPDITDTSLNNFKQGYTFLKTLSEYSDAVDC